MIELNSYKLMTIKNLINSAKKIMEEEGIDNITIRKVGDLAGFNSATIYNYFENLEHLKVFVCLQVLDSYIEDIGNYISPQKDNVLSDYYGIWECFIKHTMENISAYYTIFFNNLDRSLSDYIVDYYAIFPFENKNYGSVIDSMLNNSSIEERNIILLKELSKRGYIDEELVEYVNDISSFSYEAILRRIYKGELEIDEGISKMRRCVFGVLESNLKKTV
ncbi:TetR/AcrR family transcriptional regulator [Peptostreptococcus canis]|nr:AcrR family transcriptional regulator [Peptostreptococcus canis]